MGENFAVKPLVQPFEKVITDVEFAISRSRSSQPTKDDVRQRIVHHLRNMKTQIDKKQIADDEVLGLKNDLKFTKDFFKINNHLLILKADKGRATIIMEKSVYNQKVCEMLPDSTTYKLNNVTNKKSDIINFDPTSQLQNQCEVLVQEMLKKNYIDSSLKDYIIDNNSLSPRFYGLPKFHKANFLLRPVVSFVKSPLYGLSVTLASILNSIKNNMLNTPSSKKVISDLKSVNVNKDEIMVSFDIISMYTNISIE